MQENTTNPSGIEERTKDFFDGENTTKEPLQTSNESPFHSPSDIPFSEKTLSDEVFLQYLHDSPPIDKLFVTYSIFWIILLI